MNLPYLTTDHLGIGGRIKVKPEDFYVEETPLYLPSGEGQHVYITIEKVGIPTYVAIKKIAHALDISPKRIGHAGLKDAHAVTRQTLSIDNVKVEAIESLDLEHIKILSIKRHTNKLKTGHLAGNKFVIRVRDVEQNSLAKAKAILNILAQQGVPNFFGYQRFGNRGNTDRLGQMIVQQNAVEFVAEYLGRPQASEAPYIQTARQLIDEGNWAGALEKWPKNLSDERRVLSAIHQANGQIDVAFKALNKKIKGFFVSAFQSRLFNLLLVDRLDTLGQLEKGDVAYIHGKGASFIVEDAVIEQSRAERFEISPSGPLFGTKTLLAQGQPGQKELGMLTTYQLSLEDFKVPGLKIQGARRPYRFQLKNAKIWWDDGMVVSFELQPGAYATTVLAEIMKN